MLGFITKHPVKSILAVAIGATVATVAPFVLPIIFAGAISTAVVATVTVAMSLAVTALVYGIGRLFGFLFSRGDEPRRGRRLYREHAPVQTFDNADDDPTLVQTFDNADDDPTFYRAGPGHDSSYGTTMGHLADDPTPANPWDWNEGGRRMRPDVVQDDSPPHSPTASSADHADWSATTSFGAQSTLPAAAATGRLGLPPLSSAAVADQPYWLQTPFTPDSAMPAYSRFGAGSSALYSAHGSHPARPNADADASNTNGMTQ